MKAAKPVPTEVPNFEDTKFTTTKESGKARFEALLDDVIRANKIKMKTMNDIATLNSSQGLSTTLTTSLQPKSLPKRKSLHEFSMENSVRISISYQNYHKWKEPRVRRKFAKRKNIIDNSASNTTRDVQSLDFDNSPSSMESTSV